MGSLHENPENYEPCKQCPLPVQCAEHKLACKPFKLFVNHGNRYKADPLEYPPTRKTFDMIYSYDSEDNV